MSVRACVLSRVRLLVTPLTVARQVPLSWDYPGKNTKSGLPFPPPEDLPKDSGIDPAALAWQVGSLPSSHLGSPMRTCNGGSYLVKGDWEASLRKCFIHSASSSYYVPSSIPALVVER